MVLRSSGDHFTDNELKIIYIYIYTYAFPELWPTVTGSKPQDPMAEATRGQEPLANAEIDVDLHTSTHRLEDEADRELFADYKKKAKQVQQFPDLEVIEPEDWERPFTIPASILFEDWLQKAFRLCEHCGED